MQLKWSFALLAVAIAISAQEAQANVASDANGLVQRCTGLRFESWSEPSLRSYLLERGIIAPGSKYEELVTYAKRDCHKLAEEAKGAVGQAKHAALQQASAAYSVATSVQASASSAASRAYVSASKKAASYASMASNTAARASADAKRDAQRAEKDASGMYDAMAEKVARVYSQTMQEVNDARDYVYSSWDDSQLKEWLSKQHVAVPEPSSRSQLLQAIREPFARLHEQRPWDVFSTNYLHRWLVAHGYAKSDTEKTREEVAQLAQKYFYRGEDHVFSTWKDSDLHSWLVKHGVIKSDYEAKRDELINLMREHYHKNLDALYQGWHDLDLKNTLVEAGVLKSDATKRREELVQLVHTHAQDLEKTVSEYVNWSDARLRGFLHSHGVTTDQLPESREELLRLMRGYYQGSAAQWNPLLHLQHGATSVVDKVRNLFGDFVASPAEQIHSYNEEKFYSLSRAAASSASSLSKQLERSASHASSVVRDEL